jgi:class 3 adenylate cyclase
MSVNLPSGTVTFVFSDIAGSTALLKQLGDTEYATLLSVHRRLVREIFAAHEGQEIDTQGDAFFYSFVRARQAVAAAVEVTRAHTNASWPGGVDVRVRLGLHTGEPAVGDEGYTGIDVVRASRIAAIGRAGQVLVSDTTRAIVAGDLGDGIELRPLGERALKDIDRPEPLFELVVDGGPEPMPAPVPAADGPDEEADDAGLGAISRDFARKTRERIESRVLAQLQESLGADFPLGKPRRPRPPKRRMSREIERLGDLRASGALTEEQYRRAVDRILEEDAG